MTWALRPCTARDENFQSGGVAPALKRIPPVAPGVATDLVAGVEPRSGGIITIEGLSELDTDEEVTNG